MPVTDQLLDIADVRKIFASRQAGIDQQALRRTLAELSGRGRLTNRDETLFEHLRELKALSLDQIRRLLWPRGKESTTYNRLYFLTRQQLLSDARVPLTEMREWGLAGRKVYALGPGGWMWLNEEVDKQISQRHLRREQVLHDLLVAEIYMRLLEAVRLRGKTWTITWAGEEATSFYNRGDTPVIAPDGLAIISQQQGDKVATLPLFIELDKGREAHGRPSSDWGRKVGGYNRFFTGDWKMHPQLSNLPAFPQVAVITHGAQRLLNLAQAIKKHGQEAVVYRLALWEDLMGHEDALLAPVWLIIAEGGKMIGQEREHRQPLLLNREPETKPKPEQAEKPAAARSSRPRKPAVEVSKTD